MEHSHPSVSKQFLCQLHPTLTPLPSIRLITAVAMGGCAPETMGCSPVASVRNLLAQNGAKVDDYDAIELHEAFAAQYIACEKDLELDRSKTNVNGSGIGLGHPVGSSGSRIMVSLLHHLQRTGKKRGLASICGGGGVSTATEIVME